MTAERVNFTVLQQRLLVIVRGRIRNGEYTERGLARMLGISQSQIHNVLKGARTLHTELADRIMAKLELTAQQLLEVPELEFGIELQQEAHTWPEIDDLHADADAPEPERLRNLKKPPAAASLRAAGRSADAVSKANRAASLKHV